MVPVVRVLYVLFSLTMLTKSLITLKFCKETKQGQIRRAETKGVSVFHMLGEYRHLIPSSSGQGGAQGRGGVGDPLHHQYG